MPVLMTWSAMFCTIVAVTVMMYKFAAVHPPRFFFSVRVPPEFEDSQEGREIVRECRLTVLRAGVFWTVAVLLCALWSMNLPPEKSVPLSAAASLVALMGTVIGWFAAYARARRRVQAHAAAHADPSAQAAAAAARPAPPMVPAPVQPLWTPGLAMLAIGPFLLLGAAALYLRARWNDMPQRFPLHWNAAGQVDNWGTPSMDSVFMPLIVASVLLVVVLAVFSAMTTRMPRRFASARASELEQDARRAMLAIIMGVLWLVAGIFSVFSVTVPFNESTALPKLPMFVLFAGVPALLLVAVAMSLRIGRLLKEAAVAAAAAGEPLADESEDRFWKWGMFYHNPNDPALFVPQRMSMGWTLNTGRPAAWLILLGPLLLALAGVVAGLLCSQ